MTDFIKYPKISNKLCDLNMILTQRVTVTEKLDGANASIWLDSSNTIVCGSRNQIVTSFRGLPEYAKAHDGINRCLLRNPDLRLFGEWLVPHTVKYRESALNKFYLFDIYDVPNSRWWSPFAVKSIADTYGIETPHYHYLEENVTIEMLDLCRSKSYLTAKANTAEGVVVRCEPSTPGCSDLKTTIVKYVSESFRETKGHMSDLGSSPTLDYLAFVAATYITRPRVHKAIYNIVDLAGEPLKPYNIPEVMRTVFDDVLTEEILEIAHRAPHAVDFKTLRKHTDSLVRPIVLEYLGII